MLIFVPHTRARELQAEHFVDEIRSSRTMGETTLWSACGRRAETAAASAGSSETVFCWLFTTTVGLGPYLFARDALDDPLTRGNPDFRALKVFAIGVDELRAVLALALNEVVSPVASAMSVISSTKCSACISRARMRREIHGPGLHAHRC